MTTTITVTPRHDLGVVRITATGTTNIIKVFREDALGRTDVRTMASQLPGMEVSLEDWEAPLGETIRYTAWAADNTIAYASTKLNSQGSILVIPQTPLRRVYLPIVTDLETHRRQPGAADQIIGRPEPLVTILPLGARAGSIRVICDDYRQARQIEALYQTGYTLLLRQPHHHGLNLYHLATAVAIDSITRPGSPAMWSVSIDYIEQARPIGDLMGTQGWDWSKLAAKYTDYYALTAIYDDLAAVAAGDTNA